MLWSLIIFTFEVADPLWEISPESPDTWWHQNPLEGLSKCRSHGPSEVSNSLLANSQEMLML